MTTWLEASEERERQYREQRIEAWKAYTRSKGCTLVERSWDVTHNDDLTDYAILRVNEEEALRAFVEKQQEPSDRIRCMTIYGPVYGRPGGPWASCQLNFGHPGEHEYDDG